jgi:chromosome segregation ATPase
MGIFSSKTKNELEKLIEENDELKNTLHTFVQKHQSLTELDNKISESQKSFSEISTKVENLKKQLTKFEEDFTSRKSAANSLNDLVEKLEGRKKDLESTIAILEQNSSLPEEVLKQLSDKGDQLEELNEQYLNLQKNISFLKQEEERLNNLLIQRDGNMDEALFKLKKAEDDFSKRVSDLKNEESRKLSIIKSLDEKIHLSEEIKNTLDASISSFISQLTEKEKLFTELAANRDKILEEIRKNKSSYDELEYKFNFHKENLWRLEEDTKALTEKKNILSDEVRKFESIKNELQEKILQLRTNEDNLNEAIAAKQKIIEGLEKRKFDVEETYLQLENNLSQVLQKFIEEQTSAKSRIAILKQEILDKEKEISAKERLLLDKTSQIAEYGGLTKILQKERATTEQIISNLKEQQVDLNEQLPGLREKINKQKLLTQQLKNEIDQLEGKKESVEKELKSIITQINNSYSNLNETKQKLQQEVLEKRSELEEIKEQIEQFENVLRNLKVEVKQVDTQKEQYTAKVSELIALEKSLKHSISEHEKKLTESNKDDSNIES